MTTKGIPGIVAIVVITAILLIPQGMTSTLATHPPEEEYQSFAGDPHHHFPDLTVPDVPNYVEDTIGDVKIKALFHFNKDGLEIVDSFRIINQLGGYGQAETIQFQLLGGVGGDKAKLYTATDMTYALGHLSVTDDYREFDVDVYLYHRGDGHAFRHFFYEDCDVVGYSVATLHDGDETFSGQTKFVLADAFTFSCLGFQLHCPICIMMGADEAIKAETQSSKDLRETQTWRDIYRYANP
ncbi:MAG: hypothetical protein ACE5EJ_01890 [Nitrosopumilaceae archaeon]